jgi:hypothetical protein
MPVQFDQGGGVTRNASATGIYFVNDVALEQGAAVRLKLDFKEYPGGPIRVKCTGQVVRVEPCDGKFGVAAAIGNFLFVRVGGTTDEPD